MTKERTTSPNLDAPAVPTLTSRHTAEALWFNRGCWSILADSKSTGGSYCVFEVEMPQGVVDEPHIHDHTSSTARWTSSSIARSTDWTRDPSSSFLAAPFTRPG
jgi:hypothetical protein